MITIEQKGASGIIIFDRNEEGKKIITEVKNFKPYFYAEDFLEGNFTTIYGEKCKQIFTNSSRDVTFERQKYKKVYEADIHYTDRFLIDRIKTPIPKRNLRKCYIDIENDDSLDTINTPKPITVIGCYDNYLNKAILFINCKEKKQEKTKDVSYYYFDNEQDMINYFIKFIIETDPDLLIAYNADFDFGYIANRARKLQLNINSISPLNYIKIDKWGAKIYGRVIIDLLKLIKKNFIKRELFSYSLDNTAKHLLGKGKVEVDKTKGTLWRENLNLLLEYNLQDVMLIKEIDEQYSVIDFYDTLRRWIGCGWDRVSSFSYLHDMETLRKGKELKYIIPRNELTEFKKAEGAFVQEPEKGLYEWIINLDIKAMYPYAIISANISPETLSEDGNIIIEKNLRFKAELKGLIPTIIEEELKTRDKAKKAMFEELRINKNSTRYKALNLLQYAFKILCNSWYGIFNTEFYILKDRNLTEAVTSFSRQAIKWAISIVEKEGYEVIYTDTDGIYIKSKCSDKNNTKKIGKDLQEKINNSFKDFMKTLGIDNGYLEIKFENIYDSFFIGSKKHYFGHICWNEDNEVDEMAIKGYEVIRVDTAKVCKEMMDTFFRMILEKKGQNEISNYIRELKKKLPNLSLTDIGIPKPYRAKNKVKTAWFKSIQFSNQYLNLDIKEGERVFYVYGFIQGLPKTDGFAFRARDLNTLQKCKVIINWDRMIEVLINKKVERLYQALGWTEQKNIKSLSDYE